MKLITKPMAAALMAAYEHSAETGESGQEIIGKFFTPWAGCTWFVSEGMPVDVDGAPTTIEEAADWHLFGLADMGHGPSQVETGYVMLSDLADFKGPFGLKIERDRHYSGTMDAVIAEYKVAI